jgi:hypothetical protein
MAQHVQGVQILSGAYPKLFIADDGSFRAYGNLLTSLKRSVNTQELAGGYSGLSFDAAGGKMMVVWDRDCPFGCMFSVNPDRLQEYRAADWEMMNDDGAILSPRVGCRRLRGDAVHVPRAGHRPAQRDWASCRVSPRRKRHLERRRPCS